MLDETYPITSIGFPPEFITLSEVNMLVKHKENMIRVIDNSYYRNIANGDLTPFKIELNRIENYLIEINKLQIERIL